MKKMKSDRWLDRALHDEFVGLNAPFDRLGAAMIARVEFHRQLCLRHQRFYYWSGMFFSLSIPIVSALVTWMMTNPGYTFVSNLLPLPVDLFGVALTIMTIVNSVLRPAEEFQSSSHTLVRLHDWEMGLALGIKKAQGNAELLNHLFAVKDLELSRMGEAMAEVVFRKSGVEDDKNEAART